MIEPVKPKSKHGQRYGVFLGLGLTILIFSGILDQLPGAYFEPYFGGINPMQVSLLITLIGVATLWVLNTSHGFLVLASDRVGRGMFLSFVYASVFAAAIIVADYVIIYPEDLNVPVPGEYQRD